jgi:hypothetical protein
MAGDLEATALQLEKWLSPVGPTPERLWRRSASFLETVVLGIRHLPTDTPIGLAI